MFDVIIYAKENKQRERTGKYIVALGRFNYQKK